MTTDPYALARTAVLDARAALVALSRDIFAHPELNFAEHYSSARVADELERHGFTVERVAPANSSWPSAQSTTRSRALVMPVVTM